MQRRTFITDTTKFALLASFYPMESFATATQTTQPIRVMTATTSQHLVFEKSVMDDLLKGRGGIGDYLIDRWENYDRFWQATDKAKTKWVMWLF